MLGAREVLESQCDFPFFIEESIQKFSEFDFSDLGPSMEKYQELFVIDNLENKEAFEKLKKLSDSFTAETSLNDRIQETLNLMKKNLLSNKKFEYNRDMFTRVKKFKAYVSNFVKEKGLQDGELILVVHSRFSKSWTAEAVDEATDEFVNYHAPLNCEVFETDV